MVSSVVLAKKFAMEKLVVKTQMCALLVQVFVSHTHPFPSLPTANLRAWRVSTISSEVLVRILTIWKVVAKTQVCALLQ